MGNTANKPASEDPWAQAASKAVEAGLIVVVAAGNDGPSKGTVTTPGIAYEVITVGSIDDKGTVTRKDDTVSNDSGRGPTLDGLIKPDIFAPGVNLTSTSSSEGIFLPYAAGKAYVSQSGTSLATPIVSGICALLLQAKPTLTHGEIKKILSDTSEKVIDPSTNNAEIKGALNPINALAYINKSLT